VAGGVAVVTGATSQTGSAIVDALLGSGFAVGLFDGDEKSLDDAVRALDLSGAPIVGRRLAVDNRTEVANAIADIVAWRGRVDVLVHCADHDDRIDTVPSVHERPFLRSAEACFGAAIEVMRLQHGGRLVAVAPPVLGPGDQSVMRATLRSYVEALAREVGGDGIAVNAVLPGWIGSEAPDAGCGTANTMLPSIALGRCGTPGEVAAAALFLSGHQSSYVTGECMRVSGGMRD